MSKMTVIQLLNKIANNEQPKHIIFDTDDWYWGYDSYVPKSFLKMSPDVQANSSLFVKYRIDYCLNDEVEILEENKAIKKLNSLNNVGGTTDLVEFKDKQQLNNHILKNKINELIEEVNKLKEDK